MRGLYGEIGPRLARHIENDEVLAKRPIDTNSETVTRYEQRWMPRDEIGNTWEIVYDPRQDPDLIPVIKEMDYMNHLKTTGYLLGPDGKPIGSYGP
jgi:hypothetical protein